MVSFLLSLIVAIKIVNLIYTQKRLCLTLLLIALSFLNAHFSASAAEPKNQPRVAVQEQTRTYTDRSSGFSLELPKDFRLSSEQGDLLYFQSPKRKGTMIVRTVPGLSLRTVQDRLRNGLHAEAISINPTGSPESLQLQGAQGLMMDAGGNIQGRELLGKLAGIFGPNGQGYMVLIGSVHERWIGFRNTANNMIDSFKVTRAQPGFEHERWEYRLAGAHLLHYGKQGNYTNGAIYAQEYHFCRDRTFQSRFNTAQTQFDGWSTYTSSTGRKSKGTWSVSPEGNDAYLILVNKRGPQQMFLLSEREGRIIMDNAPFQFATNTLCPD